MDLLNTSCTKESSVLTEGEKPFTLYENTNMANTQIMYYYFPPCASKLLPYNV